MESFTSSPRGRAQAWRNPASYSAEMSSMSSVFRRKDAARQEEPVTRAAVPLCRLSPPHSVSAKDALRELNERFGSFAENVRLLETQNKSLQRELEERRQSKTSALSQAYDPEIANLRRSVHEAALERQKIKVEQQHLEEDICILREKCAAEVRRRSHTEGIIMAVEKGMRDSHLSRAELEKEAQTLVEEKIILSSDHREEMAEIMTQVKDPMVSVEFKHCGKENIYMVLRDLRKELECEASENIQQPEQYFQAGITKLSEAAEMNKESIQVREQQIKEQRRQLQSKTLELEMVKCRKEALENQLNEAEEQHVVETTYHQDTIRQLEKELKDIKCKLSVHLAEYQDLLNVKMELDMEIASYRKLLEGEETRIFSISALQPVHRILPGYNLLCYPKEKSTTSKAEPQFKLVDEIITETTNEFEISENEEKESKEMKGEGDSAQAENMRGKEEKKTEQCDTEVTPCGEDVLGSEETPEDRSHVTKDCKSCVSGEEEAEEGRAASEGEPGPETEDMEQTGTLPKEGKKTENKEDKKGSKIVLAAVQVMKQDQDSAFTYVGGASTIKVEGDKTKNENATELPKLRDTENSVKESQEHLHLKNKENEAITTGSKDELKDYLKEMAHPKGRDTGVEGTVMPKVTSVEPQITFSFGPETEFKCKPQLTGQGKEVIHVENVSDKKTNQKLPESSPITALECTYHPKTNVGLLKFEESLSTIASDNITRTDSAEFQTLSEGNVSEMEQKESNSAISERTEEELPVTATVTDPADKRSEISISTHKESEPPLKNCVSCFNTEETTKNEEGRSVTKKNSK